MHGIARGRRQRGACPQRMHGCTVRWQRAHAAVRIAMEPHMLTLSEIESTQQIEFELQLEALDEQSLRDLLADAAELRRIAPPHLSDDELRSIAEATLIALLARNAPAPQASASPASQPAWAQWLEWFWAPLR
jgi:hypothetical protein